jgi:hypothetical protein
MYLIKWIGETSRSEASARTGLDEGACVEKIDLSIFSISAFSSHFTDPDVFASVYIRVIRGKNVF